ncbi:hypothetical protein [Streptomyces gilvus]|uniref:hypothetical protein n=1 Tax=Streptomyces gilvus TaxID=2920937 RepID=UPI001F0E7E11|nr:hypothetical protein [Streptomyces sp. CME 23]MCH5672919.1 hypothetical protein [Streptomyces sp. CME 23]
MAPEEVIPIAARAGWTGDQWSSTYVNIKGRKTAPGRRVLVRFWAPEIRKKSDTLESDLRIFSGRYFVMSFLGAALGGYWQLWLGVGICAAVQAGIWYTNRRASGHD